MNKGSIGMMLRRNLQWNRPILHLSDIGKHRDMTTAKPFIYFKDQKLYVKRNCILSYASLNATMASFQRIKDEEWTVALIVFEVKFFKCVLPDEGLDGHTLSIP